MPNGAAIPAHDRPVFVLAQHRSGGTLLTRLLNCHPALVIWGEHAGILNKLAESYQVLARHSELLPERSTAELQRTILAGRLGQTEWRPWNAPFGDNEFVAGCRTLVRGLFTPGVGPGQRWGFKEIRYHSPALVGFLRRLFPAAQFILLDRDPVELCVSDMLVSWSLDQLLADGVQHDSKRLNTWWRIVSMRSWRFGGTWSRRGRSLPGGRSGSATSRFASRRSRKWNVSSVFWAWTCVPRFWDACAWSAQPSPERPTRRRPVRAPSAAC